MGGNAPGLGTLQRSLSAEVRKQVLTGKGEVLRGYDLLLYSLWLRS